MISDPIGGAISTFFASVIDQVMTAIWTAAVWLLRTAFELVDQLLGFGDGSQLVDEAGRPAAGTAFAEIWPTLRWIGGAVAVGLFFWQLTSTMLRGGTGFWRAASGPVAYGIATAMTLGIVAALLGAAEGITALLLREGLDAANFRTILDNPSMAFSDNPQLDSSLDSTVRAVLLGLVGLFGVIPAALGYALQMIFRQAAIIVLIATIPITAAGLMTNTTAAWFWRSLRWLLAAVLLKPALALVLVVGVNALSAPAGGPGRIGIGELLAGTGVLLIALFCPLALFRLLAFVEPGTNAGATARSVLSRHSSSQSSSGGSTDAEQANTSRFDDAAGGRGGATGAGGTGSAGSSSAAVAAGAAGGPAAASAVGTGAGAGGSSAAGGAAAGGGAGGAAGGAVGAVNAAVGAAAQFSTNYASAAMDATGIGQGGGVGGAGRSGGRRSGGGSGGDDGGPGDAAGGPAPDTDPPDLPAPVDERPDDRADDDGPPMDWDGTRRGEQRPPQRGESSGGSTAARSGGSTGAGPGGGGGGR